MCTYGYPLSMSFNERRAAQQKAESHCRNNREGETERSSSRAYEASTLRRIMKQGHGGILSAPPLWLRLHETARVRTGGGAQHFRNRNELRTSCKADMRRHYNKGTRRLALAHYHACTQAKHAHAHHSTDKDGREDSNAYTKNTYA